METAVTFEPGKKLHAWYLFLRRINIFISGHQRIRINAYRKISALVNGWISLEKRLIPGIGGLRTWVAAGVKLQMRNIYRFEAY